MGACSYISAAPRLKVARRKILKMLIKTIGGGSELPCFRYRVFDINTSPDSFGSFRKYVDIWKNKITISGFPKWNDYDVSDFIGCKGQYSLSKRVDCQNSDFKYVLWGHGLTWYYKMDMTTHFMSELYDKNKNHMIYGCYGDLYWKYVLFCMNNLFSYNGIGYGKMDLGFIDRKYTDVRHLDLLIRKNSQMPNHVLSLFSFT